MSDLIINSDNFEQYFFDVRKNRPQKGQAMACYKAMAELVEGAPKRNLVDLLYKKEKALPAVQIMRKLFCAAEKEATRVVLEIAQDLAKGMSVKEVLEKPYKYVLEMYYYVDPQYVPKDDPHWSIINVLNMNEFVDRMHGLRMKTRIIDPAENSGATEKKIEVVE